NTNSTSVRHTPPSNSHDAARPVSCPIHSLRCCRLRPNVLSSADDTCLCLCPAHPGSDATSNQKTTEEQKPAEHKKPKKAAVSSRALELHKREMQSYSVTVLFVLLASVQAQPAQPAQPVVLSDDDDSGEKEVTPAETGASGKRYISLD